jgi:hypothetical protein
MPTPPAIRVQHTDQRVTYAMSCVNQELMWAKAAQLHLVMILLQQHRIAVGIDGVSVPFHQVATFHIRAHARTLTTTLSFDFLPPMLMASYVDDQLRWFRRDHSWWRSPRSRWRLWRQWRQQEPGVTQHVRQDVFHLFRELLDNMNAPATADVTRPTV